MLKRLLITILYLLLGASPLKAAALILNDVENGRWLGPELELLQSEANDPRSVLQSPHFFKLNKEVPSFGYTSKKYWAKLEIESTKTSDTSYTFVFEGPIEEVQMFHFAGGTMESMTAGLFTVEPTVDYRYPAFKVQIKPGRNTILFTQQAVAPHYPLQVFTEAEFTRAKYRKHLFIAFIYGVSLILLILAIVVTITLPKKSNVYFLASYISALVFSLFITGAMRPMMVLVEDLLSISLLGTDQFIYRNWIVWWGCTEYFSLVFAWTFLELRQKAKWPFILLFRIGLVSAVALGVVSKFYPVVAIQLFTPLFHVLVIYFAFESFKRYRQGFRPALYYGIGWTTYFISTTVQFVYFNGLIEPTFLTAWGLIIGSLTQFFFFGLSIFDKQDFMEKALTKQAQDALRSLEASNSQLQLNFDKIEKQGKAINVFVSPTVQSEVVAGVDPLYFKPMLVNKIIAFADMRDYTSFAEKHDLQITYETINNCFEQIMEPVFQQRGEVDKTQGDCVMMVFKDNMAHNCLEAILMGRKRLSEQNRQRVARGIDPVKYGTGIAFGRVMSGNFGCTLKMDRTVIGDAVNIAARIESESKRYKVDILVSEDFYRLLNDYPHARAIDSITLKGKSTPTTVYEIYGHNTDNVIAFKNTTREALEEVVRLKAKEEYGKCIELLEQLIATCPKHTFKEDSIMDQTLEVLLQICQQQAAAEMIKRVS